MMSHLVTTRCRLTQKAFSHWFSHWQPQSLDPFHIRIFILSWKRLSIYKLVTFQITLVHTFGIPKRVISHTAKRMRPSSITISHLERARIWKWVSAISCKVTCRIMCSRESLRFVLDCCYLTGNVRLAWLEMLFISSHSCGSSKIWWTCPWSLRGWRGRGYHCVVPSDTYCFPKI